MFIVMVVGASDAVDILSPINAVLL
jgi:hypothetical protein